MPRTYNVTESDASFDLDMRSCFGYSKGMNSEKKPWFYRVSFNLWIPISWEGWLLMLAFIGSLGLVGYLNGANMHDSINLKKHWYILLEFAVPVILFYVLSKGCTRR